jgi:hypothetical protein
MKQSAVSRRQSAIGSVGKTFSVLLFLLLIAYCSLLPVSAQDDEQNDTAPPPLKIISKEENRQLSAETDVKKRTKLALELMEIRLKKAEGLNSQERFSEMFDELGCFHALIDKALEFLEQNDHGGGKILNNFKRVEISLRTFLPRIEVIRRDLPVKYEFYVRGLAKHVRQARSKAIEPFFDGSVVKDGDN